MFTHLEMAKRKAKRKAKPKAKQKSLKIFFLLHALALEDMAKVTGLTTDELKKLKEELLSEEIEI